MRRYPSGIAAAVAEKIAPGKKLDQLMTVMDVFPTLAAAAGVDTKIPAIDGINMWPAIENNARVERKGFVYLVLRFRSTARLTLLPSMKSGS